MATSAKKKRIEEGESKGGETVSGTDESAGMKQGNRENTGDASLDSGAGAPAAAETTGAFDRIAEFSPATPASVATVIADGESPPSSASSPDDAFSIPLSAGVVANSGADSPEVPRARTTRAGRRATSGVTPAAAVARPRAGGRVGAGSPPEKARPILAASLTLGAVLLCIALLSYKSNQAFFFSDPRGLLASLGAQYPLSDVNAIGSLGGTFAITLFGIAGLGAFFIPLCLFYAAGCCMFHHAGKLFPWRVSYMLFSFLTLVTLLARFSPESGVWNGDGVLSTLGFLDFVRRGLGGAIGDLLYKDVAGFLLGKTGSLVLFPILNVFCFAGILMDDHVRKTRDVLYSGYVWFKNFFQNPSPFPPRTRRVTTPLPRIGADAEKPGAAASASAAKSATTTAVSAISDDAFATLPEAAQTPAGDASDGRVARVSFDDYTLPPPDSLPVSVRLSSKEFSPAISGKTNDPANAAAADATDDGTPSETDPAVAPEADAPADGSAGTAAAPEARAPRSRPAPAGTLRIIDEEVVERAEYRAPLKRRGDYQFPPVGLLSEPPPAAENSPQEDYAGRAARLLTTLSEFKIRAEMGDVQSGPVITRYEIVPAPGVKVEKIAGLANNLAMNLKAESVRVLAPVPGKGTVGIEVPNQKAKAVSLREIIESRAWENSKAEIPIVLGKDVTGKPIIENLAKMPHCLIAGSTGSGKSVCINGIVASLIYHAGPDELRFIMVDPKVVELQIYNQLPHMLIPVVTEPKKVPAALKYLISEMGKRYKYFAKLKVKNIASFNAKILAQNAKLAREREEAEAAQQMDFELSPEERVASAAAIEDAETDGDDTPLPTTKLPYIICFIDELADLMMVAPAEIETGIARLAQLARAAGIHLILATQRPSVNVITGIIKANLPTRIAFKVTSLMDSRTILDQKGAETLIGRGDMLFIPPGGAHLVRAQGAYVSEEEIEAIVKHIALTNGEPEYDDEVLEMIERIAAEDAEDDDNAPTEGTGEFDDEDPVLSKAWNLISATKKASTSFLQRKLSIGYGRAAKIMDTLEAKGYIGPDKGPGTPRDILHD